jgi:predicted ATPase
MVTIQNLPSQSTSFIGRRTEIKDIAELLRNPECRLLTLVGPGGIGKTRLAIESAIRLPAPAFPDGVYFVALAALDSTSDLPRTLAHSLRLDVSDSAGYDERLVDYLSGKHLLLIFDNYEQLLPDVTFLNQILHSAPNVSLLVTSRSVLGMRLEWVFQVNG